MQESCHKRQDEVQFKSVKSVPSTCIFYCFLDFSCSMTHHHFIPGVLSIFEALQILEDLGDPPRGPAIAAQRGADAPEWLQLEALVHDLGKIMALPQLAGEDDDIPME